MRNKCKNLVDKNKCECIAITDASHSRNSSSLCDFITFTSLPCYLKRTVKCGLFQAVLKRSRTSCFGQVRRNAQQGL